MRPVRVAMDCLPNAAPSWKVRSRKRPRDLSDEYETTPKHDRPFEWANRMHALREVNDYALE